MSPTAKAPRPTEIREAESADARDAALYVHIPFCVVKCGYCDFNSFAGVDLDRRRRLVAAMQREVEARCKSLRPRTIFMGGGTPTQLETELLNALLQTIREVAQLDQVVEWTSEANPESCEEGTLETLVNNGVTRFSIGVQSWDPERLRFMDRPHGPEDAERAFRRARATGARASLDMIFGIPGQSLAEWQLELERSLALEPDHMSCYQLTFEPGTALEAARRRGEVEPLADEVLRDMFEWTQDRMQEAGYACYELSNFAKPGQACQHNIAYWRGADYVGIGPGAASHQRGHRATNLRPIEAYAEAIESSAACASFEAEFLAPERRAREAVWIALRTREGVELASTLERCGLAADHALVDEFERNLARGDLEHAPQAGYVRVPRARMIFTDEIAARFL